MGAILSSLISKLFFLYILVKRLEKFKIVIMLEILLSIVFATLLIVSLVFNEIWLLYLSVGFFTMLLYPLFPSIGEYCCEFMHPIRESTVMGILVGVAQLFSFAVVLYFLRLGNGSNNFALIKISKKRHYMPFHKRRMLYDSSLHNVLDKVKS